ncbi:zinc-ribbon domain-containing protein [Caballeronia sp. Lep1P3]|uniref:zinc-ribbon domain-containing protein n=1 Tax=Caballeronia sp. Lep1P3 TaxID=2878150 RepID=UPI000A036EB9|nr:zinc-ribbon domain-containing protein [Caballeronia sp. Lep1P3]
MFGGRDVGHNRGEHDRGRGGSHGNSHDNRHGHHGNSHGNYAGHTDERSRASNEGWGKTPGAAPAPAPAQLGVTCPQCGAGNSEGARFCSRCATSLQPQACAKCNQPLAQGAKFCSQCGAPVST